MGFLRQQAAVLILALVFMSYMINGDFSELVSNLCKGKSYLLHRVLVIKRDYIHEPESYKLINKY